MSKIVEVETNLGKRKLTNEITGELKTGKLINNKKAAKKQKRRRLSGDEHQVVEK